MTADPMPELVRRAQAAHAAFVAWGDRMDPASPAAYGCWEAALQAAGVSDLLARVAELEADLPGGQKGRADAAMALLVERTRALTSALIRARTAEKRVAELEAEARQRELSIDAAGTPTVHRCDPPDPTGIPTGTRHRCTCGRNWTLNTPEIGPVPPGGAAWFPEADAAGTPAPGPADDENAPNEPLVQALAEYYRYLDCPTPVDPADPDDCANMAAVTIQWLRTRGGFDPDPRDALNQVLAGLDAEADREDQLSKQGDIPLLRAGAAGGIRMAVYRIREVVDHIAATGATVVSAELNFEEPVTSKPAECLEPAGDHPSGVATLPDHMAAVRRHAAAANRQLDARPDDEDPE